MRFFLILLSLASASVFAQPSELLQLDKTARAARQSADLRALQIYRTGLERTLQFVQARPDLFPPQRIEKRILIDAKKMQVRGLWKALLDYQLALESLEHFHRDFALLGQEAERERSLALTYAAHLARYRYALDFIERAENDSELSKVLNEPVRDLGLEAGSYERFKLHFLNVGLGAEFAALTVLYKAQAADAALTPTIDADSRRIWDMGRGNGSKMTALNALAVMRGMAQRAVFPAQAGISEWMGDTKILRQNQALISAAQIAEIIPKMRPGDILLERREWYFSNIGLPGFWSHAAIYVGSAPERRAYFDDAEVRAWVQRQGIADGDYEKLLAQRYPAAYQSSLASQEHGHVPRVLEAISEGVSFTTLEHSAAADSLAVLRPRLSKKDQAFALLRAFGYAGRPYDFDFDFQTDNSLVCTELVYKSYAPAQDFAGLHMQPEEIVGRLAIPANDLARDFDNEFQTPRQQWDMVLFLDGDERNRRALDATVAAFRTTWQRPKWHVLLAAAKPARAKSKP